MLSALVVPAEEDDLAITLLSEPLLVNVFLLLWVVGSGGSGTDGLRFPPTVWSAVDWRRLDGTCPTSGGWYSATSSSFVYVTVESRRD